MPLDLTPQPSLRYANLFVVFHGNDACDETQDYDDYEQPISHSTPILDCPVSLVTLDIFPVFLIHAALQRTKQIVSIVVWLFWLYLVAQEMNHLGQGSCVLAPIARAMMELITGK
jgi:hypothetical protein